MVDWIRCPQCDWQNEPTALRCGGCGQPLRMSQTLRAVGNGAAPAARPSAPPAGTVSESDLPTLYDTSPAPAPAPATTPARGSPLLVAPAAAAAAAAPWPPAPTAVRPATRGRGCLGRGLLALTIAVVVVGALASSAWGFAIRPTLHRQVDGLIGQALNRTVASLPAISDEDIEEAGPTFQATAGDITTALQRNIPPGSGITDISARFQQGTVLVNYTAYSATGTIQTTPQVQGGRLQVTETHVDGPLGWVESGDEWQTTVNRELALLSTKTPHGFKSVSVTPGAITLVLNTGN